ncbi:MAG: hypothetical protein JKY02_07440 [Flavobacteriaceae bacterium]|nr:hypothetical protein [Flavobacteriaceae bacterium]
MKLINKSICFFLVCTLFLVTGCKKEPKNDKDNDFCYTYEGRPDITLTYKEVIGMLQEYDTTRKNALHAVNGTEDTRVNFFKIEDLKAYLAYVEKLSKDKKIKLTGINIISAAYPDDKKYGRKSKYQTVILMPTTTVNGREDVSFDPLYSGIRKPATFADLLERYRYNSQWTYDRQNKVNIGSFFSFPSFNSLDMIDQGTGLSSAANRAGITPPM